MSIDISIEIEADYLYVLVNGVHNIDLAVDLLEEVLEASMRHNLPKILIDYRQLQNLSPSLTETYIYAASVAQRIQKHTDTSGQPLRLAYLGPETILKDGEYGVEVAAEYGFYEAKRTTNLDEAFEWLGVSKTKGCTGITE